MRRNSHGKLVRVREVVRGAPAPSYQLHPDPQRYQEIQNALSARGYFGGQANGEWGDDSVQALKRFQADQKLADDGKINSLTLIGLGLGPRHGAALPGQPPVPTAATPSTPSSSPSVPDATAAGSSAPPSPTSPPL